MGRGETALGTGAIILAAAAAVAAVIVVWVYWGEYLKPRQPRPEGGNIYAMMAQAVAEANLDGLAVLLSMSHDESAVLRRAGMEHFRGHAERTRRNFPGTDEDTLHAAVLRIHGARRYWRGLTVEDSVVLFNTYTEERSGSGERALDAPATGQYLRTLLEYAYFRPHLGAEAVGPLTRMNADADWVGAWIRERNFDRAPDPGPAEIQAFTEKILDGADAGAAAEPVK